MAAAHLDHPDSLLGQLQRGRGAGFLAATRERPEDLWPLLLQCITRDPRWDRQLEERGDYYARLALLTGMDLSPLREYLRHHDDTDNSGSDAWLTLGVLGRSALRGSSDAVSILREYVERGQHWSSALDSLAEVHDPGAVSGLDEVVCARCSDEELRHEIGWRAPDEEPWASWRVEHPRIARAMQAHEEAQARVHRKQGPEQYASMSLRELFSLVNQGNSYPLSKVVQEKVTPADRDLLLSHLRAETPDQARLALWGLSRLADPAAWPALREFVEGNPEMRPYLRFPARRAVRALPGEVTLETGRRWFDHREWHFRSFGHTVLERHATAEDIPRLRAAVGESLESGEMYRLCGVLEVLPWFPEAGFMPELERAFIEAPYSWARRLAAETMRARAPGHFARGAALECLWDCDADIRELACAAVALDLPGVPQRISVLARDLFEDEAVRQAAERRLAAESGH
jgi:hypothetical protein